MNPSPPPSDGSPVPKGRPSGRLSLDAPELAGGHDRLIMDLDHQLPPIDSIPLARPRWSAP